jgi:hypothetical protein
MVFPTSRHAVPGFLALVLVAIFATPLHAGGEIYGTLFLENGRHYTGEIRWDLNEVFWDDVLDAEKHEQVWVEGGSQGVQVFGMSIGDDDGYWTHHPFKIQFGHLAAIEPRGGDHVRVELKNGKVIDVRPTGTDLSESMRSLTVTDRVQGDVDVTWDEIDRVEFTGGPGEGRNSERLYGMVSTSAGDFTGFITWDKDEALTTDVLDGEDDEDGHKIAFGDIREIARAGSSASRVTLTDGSSLRLSGTNDVNDENRGIDVWVPEMGVVKIPWDEFDRVVFEPAPPSSTYDDFDGGARLYGTLTDDDGKTYTGNIIWDLDEQYTWEFLDGQNDDLEYEIPFDRIQQISHDSRHAARVQLKNGETLVLSASNDVDTDNKGIVIEMADGDEMEFDWYDFTSLEFTQP